MSVGAIRSEAMAFDGREAGLAALNGAGREGIDFQALLAMVSTGITDDDSAVKTESSRTVSVLGHLRTTIITYADGSSGSQATVMQDGVAPPPPYPFALAAATPARPTIRANSDLEPETGGDGGRHLASIAWRFMPQHRPASVSAAALGKARQHMLETVPVRAIPDPQDIGKGRLLDLMV